MPVEPQNQDQERIMALVSPILPILNEALRSGFEKYWGDDYSDAARAEHKPRTVAGIIHDHAETHLEISASEVGGLHPLTVKGLKVFNFQDQVLCRLKKVNANGAHSNYQTAQQIAYDRQETIEGLPDAAERIIAGYEQDPSGTYIERIMIARPVGGKPYWTAQVNFDGEAIKWINVTPQRFWGMDHSDWDQRNARSKDRA